MVLVTGVLNTPNNRFMNTERQHPDKTDITIYFDTKGSVLAISRTAVRLLGYTESELLDLHALDLFYHAGDLFRFHLSSGHHEVMIDEFVALKHKDKSIIDCRVTAIRPMANSKFHSQNEDDLSSQQISEQIALLVNFLTQRHWENEQQFFDSLAIILSNILAAELVFIAYFRNDMLGAVAPVTLYTSEIASADKNQLLDYAEFQNIVSRDVYCFSGGVKDIFPHYEALKQLNAESFASITLRNIAGKAIGVLGIVSHRPYIGNEVTKTLLQIASLRVTAELQRYLQHKDLPDSTNTEIIAEQNSTDSSAMYELRNLISTLNTSIYMLKKKPNDFDRILKIMENQLSEISNLSQKLRATSVENEVYRGGGTELVDLNLIAATVIATQNDLITKKRIQLKFLPSIGLAHIQGNRQQVRQIMSKLLSNTIQGTLPQSKILVEITELPAQILLKVRDSGTGLDMDRNDMFKQFYRTKSSQSHENSSNLDMSMIKDFVHQQNGRVELDSDPENGSEIRIYFPRK